VVAIATVVAVLAILGHAALLRSESPAAHLPDPVATSQSGDVSVNLDHAHLVDGWSTAHPEVLAAAVLPNPVSSAVVGLGVVVVVAAAASWLAPRVVLAGRGPPSSPATTLSGQDLLTRLGLSRR